MALGAFCLVLHGHLPWVLHHGRWPHGEDWLFEAASETWLPLLEALDDLEREGISPCWSLGLTPILLEQLRSPRFQEGLPRWLQENVERAIRDEQEFLGRGDPQLAELAAGHARRFRQLAELFEAFGRDLVAGFKRHADRGAIELLSSNATHGFHPLILHDACARAQVRAGLATSQRHLGHRPTVVWLPECAYRSSGPWNPPVLHQDQRQRAGVARLFADEGVQAFFVDTHLLRNARAEAVVHGDQVWPCPADQAFWDHQHAWGSELEPHRVVESGQLTPLTVLARCPDVSEQVWSSKVGYPGDARYLEFHKRHGYQGLRYWKVTGSGVDLADKQPYQPEALSVVIEAHAAHFVEVLRGRLQRHATGHGRFGVVCAPFDAELFGHWWHEGPRFLAAVARRLHHDPEVEPMTVSRFLSRVPADKAVSLPTGTWGAGGDLRVWLNPGLTGYWEVAYRAEDRFIDLWHRAPWRQDERVRELLTEAGRQLLLLQASDWPFVVSTGGAVDYGMRRVFDHAARLDDLCNGVEDLLRSPPALPDPVVEAALARSRLLEPVFPELDLNWWA